MFKDASASVGLRPQNTSKVNVNVFHCYPYQ